MNYDSGTTAGTEPTDAPSGAELDGPSKAKEGTHLQGVWSSGIMEFKDNQVCHVSKYDIYIWNTVEISS